MDNRVKPVDDTNKLEAYEIKYKFEQNKITNLDGVNFFLFVNPRLFAEINYLHFKEIYQIFIYMPFCRYDWSWISSWLVNSYFQHSI